MKNQTVFITLAESSVARNILRGELLQTLSQRNGARVVLITTPDLLDRYRVEFGSEVTVTAIRTGAISFTEKCIAFFFRNGFVTETSVLMQHRVDEVYESNAPIWFKQALGILIQSFPPFRSILRMVELRLRPQSDVAELFEMYNPSLVFSTVMMDTNVDIPLLREATRRKVRTIGMVRGWDNLTTYGLVRIVPDWYLAQNEFLREMAIVRHGIPKNRIRIVGTPQFDAYFDETLYVDRETYCKNLSINPHDKIILYAAVGDYIFPKEGEIADVFEELLVSKQIVESCTVVFRAHPAFESPLERMAHMAHVRPDRNAEYISDSLTTWDMKDAHMQHLVNSIRHADVVVTSGSTMMIEAALCDKPVIDIAFDGNSEVSYWFSISRWSDHATHIINLLKTGGVTVVHTKDELAAAVNDYLKDPSKKQYARKMLAQRFAGPNQGHAKRALAACISEYMDEVAK